jgi:hypothetical protein
VRPPRAVCWYVIGLSVVLKIKRTLTGDEVICVIADRVAGFELRRRQWQERVDNADRFDTFAEITQRLKRATHKTVYSWSHPLSPEFGATADMPISTR